MKSLRCACVYGDLRCVPGSSSPDHRTTDPVNLLLDKNLHLQNSPGTTMENIDEKWPLIEMTISGKTFPWHPRSYMYKRGRGSIFCFTFDDNGNQGTVLGASWMIDRSCIFDLAKKQIGSYCFRKLQYLLYDLLTDAPCASAPCLVRALLYYCLRAWT